MRLYIRFLGSGALGLGGLGATMVVHGGWQAVAAAFAILQGLVFVLTFITICAAGERPRSRRPEWAMGEGTPRGVPVASEAPAGVGARGARARARRSSRALGHA
jgi:hypothetical protein